MIYVYGSSKEKLAWQCWRVSYLSQMSKYGFVGCATWICLSRHDYTCIKFQKQLNAMKASWYTWSMQLQVFSTLRFCSKFWFASEHKHILHANFFNFPRPIMRTIWKRPSSFPLSIPSKCTYLHMQCFLS